MKRYSSLIFLSILLFSALPVTATQLATTSTYQVQINRVPIKELIKQIDFDVENIQQIPFENVDEQYGSNELVLINFGQEFGSYRGIISKMQSIGLVPASFRELLEYARGNLKDVSKPKRIVAFGSPTKRPSGNFAWQVCGINEQHNKFVGYVVEGGVWPAEYLYLAKRRPIKTSNNEFGSDSWKDISAMSTAVNTRIREAQKTGEDPDSVQIKVRTSLSYRGIALATYFKTLKSVDEANAVARGFESLEIDVLAKALTEINIKNGMEKGITCYATRCPMREVIIPLTIKGMGIIDEPIPRDIDYSVRMIYP